MIENEKTFPAADIDCIVTMNGKQIVVQTHKHFIINIFPHETK